MVGLGWTWRIYKDHSREPGNIVDDDMIDFVHDTLWARCIPVLFIFLFLTLPQITILMIMFCCYPSKYALTMDVTNVINWSFWSCILMMIAVSIILSSIFEKMTIFIMNLLWTMYDYAAFWFIFAALFYNDTTLIIGIIDAVLFYIAIIGWLTMMIMAWHEEDPDEMSLLGFICMTICIVIGYAICYFMVLAMYGPWTMIIICLFSHLMYTNVIPFNLKFFN